MKNKLLFFILIFVIFSIPLSLSQNLNFQEMTPEELAKDENLEKAGDLSKIPSASEAIRIKLNLPFPINLLGEKIFFKSMETKTGKGYKKIFLLKSDGFPKLFLNDFKCNEIKEITYKRNKIEIKTKKGLLIISKNIGKFRTKYIGYVKNVGEFIIPVEVKIGESSNKKKNYQLFLSGSCEIYPGKIVLEKGSLRIYSDNFNLENEFKADKNPVIIWLDKELHQEGFSKKDSEIYLFPTSDLCNPCEFRNGIYGPKFYYDGKNLLYPTENFLRYNEKVSVGYPSSLLSNFIFSSIPPQAHKSLPYESPGRTYVDTPSEDIEVSSSGFSSGNLNGDLFETGKEVLFSDKIREEHENYELSKSGESYFGLDIEKARKILFKVSSTPGYCARTTRQILEKFGKNIHGNAWDLASKYGNPNLKSSDLDAGKPYLAFLGGYGSKYNYKWTHVGVAFKDPETGKTYVAHNWGGKRIVESLEKFRRRGTRFELGEV